MLLDNTYGLLNLLELIFNCVDSLYQAEYEFQNSNVGGKYGKIIFERFYKNLRTLVPNLVPSGATFCTSKTVCFFSSNFDAFLRRNINLSQKQKLRCPGLSIPMYGPRHLLIFNFSPI